MYSQNDPAWVLKTLGFGPDTIGADGCYLTADADLMTWAGHPMNPVQLNDYYMSNGIYVQGELLNDSALADAFPSLWKVDGVYHCESFPCDQNQLNNDDPNLYVIVELMGPGGRTHFAPVLNWRQWTIADPWTGQEQNIGHVGAIFGWGTDPATLIGKAVKLRYIGGAQTAPPLPPLGDFTGVTCPIGVHVRMAPGSDQPIVAQPGSNPDIVDGGTTLTFDAWCHHNPKGGTDSMPTDFWTNQPDDRWFRTTSQHWVASAGIKGNPPAGLAPIADPAAPAPAPPPTPPPPAPVNKTVPAELKGVVVWETSPTYGGAADYAWLKSQGVSSVLVRGRNGDGTGSKDKTFEDNWTTRAAAARAAGLPPVLWTYWYGPSEGVTGDVATYLKGCAEYTAKVTDTPAYIIDAEDRNLPGLGAALLHLAQLTGKPVLVTTFGDPKTAGVTWDWAPVDAAVAAYEPQMYTGAWGTTGPTFQSASAEWPLLHAPFLPANDETDLARVHSFVAEVRAAGLEGVSFWYYKDATSQPVIQAYLDAWRGAPPPPPPPPPPTPPPPDPNTSAILALLQKIWDLLQKIAAALHIT